MAPDKKKHLLAGFVLACLALLLGLPTGSGLLLAVVVGIGKEVVWDYGLGMGTPDGKDAFATALGGVAGEGLFALAMFVGFVSAA